MQCIDTWRTALCGLLLAATWIADGRADDRLLENQIKTAYIYNFAKLVEWPESSFASVTSPVVIGTVGDSPLAATIAKALPTRRVHGRELSVIRLDSANTHARCHLLFISRTAENHATALAALAAGNSILTVGESTDFTHRGGMISFFPKDDETIGIEINTDAVRRADIRMSSRLLRIARPYREQDHEKDD